MDPDRWRRIEALVEAAAARDAAERATFLNDACGDDVEIRREVEALLAIEAEAEGFLASAAWRLPTLAPGTRLGPHEILELVGTGGMGEVYKARDTRLDRIVALKILPPEFAADPERRHRFEREAKTISQLNHSNICTLFDIGEAALPSTEPRVPSPGSVNYLVMEFLEGETLAARLAKGPVPLAQALDIGAQIADALAAAHKHGVVHRDLKPGNVMLTKAGVKLLDFGLAKLRAGSGLWALGSGPDGRPAATTSEPLTARGVIVGTLPYMAPEQIEGKPADARTDLWALGTILYEMLAGKRAFEGDTSAHLTGAILERDPEPIAARQPLTPPALDRLVRKCLAKVPEDRWDTAHDVADELRWIREAGGVTAAADIQPGRARRSRVALAVAGVILGTIVGAALMWALRAPPSGSLTYPSLTVGPADELNAGGVFGFIYTRGGSRTALTWTPDGEALVFVGRRDGVKQLYVRRLDEAGGRPLPGTEGAQVPAVSADGRWIAFWAAGAIKRIPTAGGPVMDLASDIVDPPLGMVWGDRGTLFFGSYDGVQKISSAGTVTEVTQTGQTERAHALPWVLPDERALLYTVRKRSWSWGDEEVVAQILATGERKPILEDAVDARYVAPDHLVFLRRGQLFLVGFDATRLELRGAPVALLDEVAQALAAGDSRDVTGAGQFAVAGTSRLAWVSAPLGDYPAAVLVTVDSSGKVEPLPAPELPYGGVVRRDPEGRRLAVTTQTLTEGRLRVWDLDRGQFAAPLPGEGERYFLLWSPDGRRVLFDWLDDGRQTLAAQPADGTAPPQVIIPESLVPSSWTPDGQVVSVSVRRELSRQIEIVRLQNGQATSHPHPYAGEGDTHPELSPDGRWLAYSSGAPGDREVYVRAYPGPGPAYPVSRDGGGAPAWHPGGREIFYIARFPKDLMMAVDFTPGSPPRIGRPRVVFEWSPDVHDLGLRCGPVRCYDVAPDGQRFYALQYFVPPPPPDVTYINLVENWLEELTAKAGGRH